MERKPLTEEQKIAARARTRAWVLANPDKVKAAKENNKEKNAERYKRYALAHKDEIRANRRKRRQENPGIWAEQQRKWKENNPDKIKEYRKTYYEKHSEELAEKSRLYREAHPEEVKTKVSECHKKWNKEHPEEVAARHKKYRDENPDIVKQSNSNWYFKNGGKEKSRMRQIIFYSVPENRIHKLLGGAKKRAKQKGLEFEEVLYDTLPFNAPTHCVCCKNELSYDSYNTKRTRKDPRPSLDRIDNSIGYTVVNTRVICFKCNCLKADASITEIANMQAYVSKLEYFDSSCLLWV